MPRQAESRAPLLMLGERAPEVWARVSGRRKRGTCMGQLMFYSGGPLSELSVYYELEFYIIFGANSPLRFAKKRVCGTIIFLIVIN